MGIIANKLAEESIAGKAAAYDKLMRDNQDRQIAAMSHRAGAENAFRQLAPELETANIRAQRAEAGLASILSPGSGVARSGIYQPDTADTANTTIPTHWR